MTAAAAEGPMVRGSIRPRCRHCRLLITEYGGIWFQQGGGAHCPSSDQGEHKPTERPWPVDVRVDPAGLNDRQLVGEACVICNKRWPMPRNRFGRLPDGSWVYVCNDCANGLVAQ